MLRALLFLFLAWPVLQPAAAERLYKWVDEQGNVQYSDKPPAQPVQRGVTEINRRGMVVKQTEGILTPEQKQQREALAAQQKLDEQKQFEARRRDKALVDSFNNVREIDAIRDRNIEQMEASMQSDQQRSAATRKRLEEYQKQLLAIQKAKRKVPEDLLTDIRDTEAEISRIDSSVLTKQGDIVKIRERAESDKLRLIELKGAKAK